MSFSSATHELSSAEWQRRKNCNVCTKKNIVNPMNIYCKTCDKYICNCCLICHQEFTTGHVITQNFYCEKKEHDSTATTTEQGVSPTDMETENEIHGSDFKNRSTQQEDTDHVDSKGDADSPNIPVCCGQVSIGKIKNQTLPVPTLEEVKQWPLSEITTDTYITGITITNDGHIFMCDSGNSKVYGYNQEGLLLCRCEIPSSPIDICSMTSTKFVTVSLLKQYLYFLECTSDFKNLSTSACVPLNNKIYCSICKSGESFLLACDCFTNVDILNFNGELLSRVFTGRYLPPTSTYIHRIYPGSTTCSFWLLDYNSQVISCCTLNGKRLLSQYLHDYHPCRTDDIIIDKLGFVYGCDVDKVYCLVDKDKFQSVILFPRRLMTDARMCWTPSQNELVLSLENDEGYMVKFFKKS